jgi:hypothetical protein
VNLARLAAGAAVMVLAVTAGTAGAARASGPAPSVSRSSVPGSGTPGPGSGSCQKMMREYPAMTRVHQQMMSGPRGMSQMSPQMTVQRWPA